MALSVTCLRNAGLRFLIWGQTRTVQTWSFFTRYLFVEFRGNGSKVPAGYSKALAGDTLVCPTNFNIEGKQYNFSGDDLLRRLPIFCPKTATFFSST